MKPQEGNVDIQEQGLLCEITTDHDFDRIVARKVFVGKKDSLRAQNWFDEQAEQLLKKDAEADPTFDHYGYSLNVYEVEVRSDY